jgi:acetyltransferase-like isoleucine patch superfamily enzyme
LHFKKIEGLAVMLQSGHIRRIIKAIADVLTPSAPNYQGWELKNFWLRLAGVNISKIGVAIGAGFQCIDGHEENIRIERHVAIGHNVHIWNFGDVQIGQFCMIAAGVTVSNGWHDKSTFVPASGSITIGPGCWIGVNATIVGSVNIGANVIIGAGALVNKDVPANSIVAGVPAKIIGMRQLPDRVWHLGDIYFCPQHFEILQDQN